MYQVLLLFRVADWFAQLNNKMGGDLNKIQTVGKVCLAWTCCWNTSVDPACVTTRAIMQYMIEIWKAAGMDMARVEFLNASEEINKKPNEYWTLVMDIARQNTLARITKCCQIMGRSESDNLSASQIFYPCMQCADIFFLKVTHHLSFSTAQLQP